MQNDKLIALDIDGTTVAYGQGISPSVLKTLEDAVNAGWRLMFVTGRSLAPARSILKPLGCPYLLALQNGAALISMPSGDIIQEYHLDVDILPTLRTTAQRHDTGVVIYGDGKSYYCPTDFTPDLLQYLEKRCKRFGEEWHPLKSWEMLPVEKFKAFKFFGEKDNIQPLAERIQNEIDCHMPVITDPYDPAMVVAQGTHASANKGNITRHVAAEAFVIAAGDDYNDIPLLEAADIAIAMGSSPQELKNVADIVAATAADDGLVEALQQALRSELCE